MKKMSDLTIENNSKIIYLIQSLFTLYLSKRLSISKKEKKKSSPCSYPNRL